MKSFQEVIGALGKLLNYGIGVLVGVAVLVFFIGLVKFIFKLGGDAKAVEEGRNMMIWGILGLFIMIAIWGIIAFFQKSFGITPGSLQLKIF